MSAQCSVAVVESAAREFHVEKKAEDYYGTRNHKHKYITFRKAGKYCQIEDISLLNPLSPTVAIWVQI